MEWIVTMRALEPHFFSQPLSTWTGINLEGEVFAVEVSCHN
jgi:hypothetical protein